VTGVIDGGAVCESPTLAARTTASRVDCGRRRMRYLGELH
jgi:hypothetical protein